MAAGDVRIGCASWALPPAVQHEFPAGDSRLARFAQVKRHAQEKVLSQLSQLDAHLASQDGPWFLGADYTALDAYVFTLCRWTRNFSHGRARELPRLGPYLQRMLARPAVQRMLANEALQPPFV